MITVPSGVVAATLDTLRACGGGRRECLVYWTSAGDGAVSAVVHPRHSASWGGVVVDGAWATSFFLELALEGRSVVAQVHTHPGSWVEHSITDDEHTLISSPGYVSIVIPSFAAGELSAGWGIWEIDEAGAWRAAERVVRWTD